MRLSATCILFLSLSFVPGCTRNDTENLIGDDARPAPEILSMDSVSDILCTTIMDQSSYGDLLFYFIPQNRPDYYCLNYLPDFYSSEEFKSFYRSLEDNIYNSERFYMTNRYGAPLLYYGGISSEVAIRADHVLFEEPAGSNIARYFDVCNIEHYTHFTFSYPSFDCLALYETTDRIPFPVFYSKGTALLQYYIWLRLNRIPKERYEALTLTIELPVETESWIRFAGENEEYMPEDPIITEPNRLLTGTVTLHIGEQ